MINDASSAGVQRGGLFNISEIRILICYILNAINEPVPVNMMANVLHYEGIANGFEVSDAVVSLANNGLIVQVDDKDDTYTVTNGGKEVADTLKTSLSITVKERAYLATMKMFAKFKNAKDNIIEITKENGATYITCSAIDGGKPFMSVKMLISDESQGNCIKEKFLENPTKIYSALIDLLTE